MGPPRWPSTMIIAAMAGIRVFATGGIGGVPSGGRPSTSPLTCRNLPRPRWPMAPVPSRSSTSVPTLEYLETGGCRSSATVTEEPPASLRPGRAFTVDHCPTPGGDRRGAAPEVGAGLAGVPVANPSRPSLRCRRTSTAIKQARKRTSRGSCGRIHPFLLARV